ncbi:protein phosphatase 2C domain-containing protein [Sporosarcina highlanderae]|uniref:Protein phosphatase 2C domain-containing protein n=1 Tax=Sporosarcina highlanderae TaxID=3035916 RepID=A0ABT8JRS8_9BACL|nr:protein phosphatase 2C domain-containing protein [Sporosarcina highlanderae]MDN4607880.1 protein phosphatase 2C domain-containing protein [Sporosarcina highlanderae]
MNSFTWVGSDCHYIDQPFVQSIGNVTVGLYGGNSSAGQYKNEDGCVIWVGEDWELAAVLDAHYSAESAELVVRILEEYKQDLISVLNKSGPPQFRSVENKLLKIFQSVEFLDNCKSIKGETACLICIRKENYLWWFSVGDCVVYVFHQDFIALDQFQLNQRQFYEWIGKVNTFDKSIPCYTSGIRELRKGTNRIFMTTDGLLECPGEPFINPVDLADILTSGEPDVIFSVILDKIIKNNVRDSTTMIAWSMDISKQGSIPSDFE